MKAPFYKALLPFVAVTLFAACSTDHDETAVTPKPETALVPYNYNADEVDLAFVINDYRESIGLAPLVLVNYISVQSEDHNAYMIAIQSVNHDYFTERSQNIVDALHATRVSENVAYNYSTANAALHAWLQSENHRANIEGDFTHFGVSVQVDAATGNKYYTNMFARI